MIYYWDRIRESILGFMNFDDGAVDISHFWAMNDPFADFEEAVQDKLYRDMGT